MFKKKKKEVKSLDKESTIQYDEKTNTYTYNGSSISINKNDFDDRYKVNIDGSIMYWSHKEMMMIYLYFGLMYKKMTSQ